MRRTSFSDVRADSYQKDGTSYVLTLTLADGVERELVYSPHLDLLRSIRDAGRSLHGPNRCYRILDTDDYERGAIE